MRPKVDSGDAAGFPAVLQHVRAERAKCAVITLSTSPTAAVCRL
jgi:hypothetical protein